MNDCAQQVSKALRVRRACGSPHRRRSLSLPVEYFKSHPCPNSVNEQRMTMYTRAEVLRSRLLYMEVPLVAPDGRLIQTLGK